MKKFLKQIRTYIFRGFLAIIPLVLSFFVIQFLYRAIDRRVTGVIEKLIGFRIPGLGILLVLILLLLVGILASHWVGRRVFSMIEKVSSRIPLVRSVYRVGKQMSSALSLPESQVFKRAVMLEHFRPGLWSLGFVVGSIASTKEPGEKLLKVFIPTAPNPTSGFLVMVKESQVRNLEWSVPDAMNTVISAGIISPKEID